MMVSGGKKVAIVIGSISDENIMKNALGILKEFGAVSYTHLDVYKRQALMLI